MNLFKLQLRIKKSFVAKMSSLVYISIKHVSMMFLFSKGRVAHEPRLMQTAGAYPSFPSMTHA